MSSPTLSSLQSTVESIWSIIDKCLRTFSFSVPPFVMKALSTASLKDGPPPLQNQSVFHLFIPNCKPQENTFPSWLITLLCQGLGSLPSFCYLLTGKTNYFKSNTVPINLNQNSKEKILLISTERDTSEIWIWPLKSGTISCTRCRCAG